MYDIINLSYHNYYMEQKNENKFLLLKNYSNFLVDLGLNISFSQKHDLEINTGKIDIDSTFKLGVDVRMNGLGGNATTAALKCS